MVHIPATIQAFKHSHKEWINLKHKLFNRKQKFARPIVVEYFDDSQIHNTEANEVQAKRGANSQPNHKLNIKSPQFNSNFSTDWLDSTVQAFQNSKHKGTIQHQDFISKEATGAYRVANPKSKRAREREEYHDPQGSFEIVPLRPVP